LFQAASPVGAAWAESETPVASRAAPAKRSFRDFVNVVS
jgi:hypothetical protein